jgi:hypothetical protein
MNAGTVNRPVLGILTLDNAFERYVGDLGNPATFDFPVLYEKTVGASTDAITTLASDAFLDPFARSAERLIARGADGIVTSCGFLALYQEKLAARLTVPIATSALLQIAMVARVLPRGQRVGVLTFNGLALSAEHLAAVGAPTDTPVVGLPDHGRFRRALLGDPSVDGYCHREAEAVETARQLLASHAGIGAIVLECTNLVPHARAIRDATGLPVYDVMTLVRWFYAGLEQTTWPKPQQSV